MLASFLFSREVVEQYNYRLKIGFPFTEYDIKWNYSSAIKYNLLGLFSGILCACLGLGGGTILGPILLHLNVHPTVMKVTSNFLVVFTSSATSLQFSMMGMMNYNYGLVLCTVAAFSGVLGNLVIGAIVKKYGRPSIVILCLGVVFAISTIVMFLDMNRKITKQVDKGIDIWSFNPPSCKSI